MNSDKKKGGAGKLLAIVIPLVLILAVCLCGVLLKHGSTIYPNVSLCGVDVGGMSAAEAESIVLQDMAQRYAQQDLVLHLPQKNLTFRADKAKVVLDVEKALEETLRYGREGNIFSCIFSWFRCRNTAFDVDISPALSLEEGYLRSQIQTLKKEIDQPLAEHLVTFDEGKQELSIVVGATGKTVDTEAFFSLVMDAYSRGDFNGTSAEYTIAEPAKLDLSGITAEHCYEATDASYDESTGIYTKEIPGFGFDEAAVLEAVETAQAGETLVFKLGEILPEVTLDSLYAERFPDLLGEYSSNHTNIPNRTHNLILAAAAIDGTILQPDEVFSFNDTVGERTAAKGYRAATIFSEGGISEASLGGGVCQVASTLYMAGLLADLKIVQRTEHMFVVDYVPFGMDATVYWKSLDYRFANNTGNPMLIRCWVEGGQVHVKYYGIENKDYTVKMTYSILATEPWEDVYEVDETKEEGYEEITVTPYTGYRVSTTKQKIKADGTVIYSETEAYSKYLKRDRVHTMGKGWVDPNAPVEETPETPDAPAETPETPAVAPETPAVTPETPAAPAETPSEPVETPAPAEPAA